MCLCSFFFFFSSRRRHTRCLSDWSSDVCSSDLIVVGSYRQLGVVRSPVVEIAPRQEKVVKVHPHGLSVPRRVVIQVRSEERRVGKECRCRCETDGQEKKRQSIQGEEPQERKVSS